MADGGIKAAQCNCITGTSYIDPTTGQCTCLPVNVKPQNIKTVTTTTATTFNLIDWAKGHPFIVAGGAALLIYLLFFRGK